MFSDFASLRDNNGNPMVEWKNDERPHPGLDLRFEEQSQRFAASVVVPEGVVSFEMESDNDDEDDDTNCLAAPDTQGAEQEQQQQQEDAEGGGETTLLLSGGFSPPDNSAVPAANGHVAGVPTLAQLLKERAVSPADKARKRRLQQRRHRFTDCERRKKIKHAFKRLRIVLSRKLGTTSEADFGKMGQADLILAAVRLIASTS